MVVFTLKTLAEKKFAEGKLQLVSGKYQQALSSYKDAEKLWPFIKNDSEFGSSKKIASSALEETLKIPAVTVYLSNNASEEDAKLLIDELRAIDGVRDVRFISKEESLAKYRETNRKDEMLLDLVSADILPALIEIYSVEIPTKEFKENVAQIAKKKPFTETVTQTSL